MATKTSGGPALPLVVVTVDAGIKVTRSKGTG